MRLIDADVHYQEIADWREKLADTYGKNDEYVQCLKSVLGMIEDAPTIEEKKGFWEWVDDMDYRCSCCHKYAYGCLGEVLSGRYKFCPYCGARMEKIDE